MATLSSNALLENLFVTQIKTLLQSGCPSQIVEIFQAQKDAVLLMAVEKQTPENGHIPFIPVIPLAYQSLNDLMAMVVCRRKNGRAYLDPLSAPDALLTPYYIFDIEDGRELLDVNPFMSRDILLQQRRLGLTATEAVALCVHRDVLLWHNIWVMDFPNALDKALTIHIGSNGNPELNWIILLENIPMQGWGTPSCKIRG